MADEKTLVHYKAGWKRLHPKAPFQKADYFASSLKHLLDILDRAEGIGPSVTECLYVHRIESDGSVVEVFKHEASSGLTVVDFTDGKKPRREYSEQKSVISEVERIITETRKADTTPLPTTSKPRIRLKASGDRYVEGGFFYRAYEPKPRGNVDA